MKDEGKQPGRHSYFELVWGACTNAAAGECVIAVIKPLRFAVSTVDHDYIAS